MTRKVTTGEFFLPTDPENITNELREKIISYLKVILSIDYYIENYKYSGPPITDEEIFKLSFDLSHEEFYMLSLTASGLTNQDISLAIANYRQNHPFPLHLEGTSGRKFNLSAGRIQQLLSKIDRKLRGQLVRKYFILKDLEP